jgi:hypothetical protein
MIRMTKETTLTPTEILDKASGFFGKSGLGLEETDRNPCCVFFEGGGGHVSITVIEENDLRNVDIETREWEHQVKRFIREL